MTLQMNCALDYAQHRIWHEILPRCPWGRERHKCGYVINDYIAPPPWTLHYRSPNRTHIVTAHLLLIYPILFPSWDIPWKSNSRCSWKKAKNGINYVVTYWAITSPRGNQGSISSQILYKVQLIDICKADDSVLNTWELLKTRFLGKFFWFVLQEGAKVDTSKTIPLLLT